ncbi:MAG: DUF2007 domain-containing protein [Candidatus Aminicenantes bacterium]|nr:DUF2007 domain-containing protein [Candidatus Aminicenantes bacterium]
MDAEEYEHLRNHYQQLSDEELLDFVQNQADEFEPEALDLIKSELRSRGFGAADLKENSKQIDRETAKGEFVMAKGCHSWTIATQAVDILAQEGISAVIDGMQNQHRVILGSGAAENFAYKIMVLEQDLIKAREFLSSFLPLF